MNSNNRLDPWLVSGSGSEDIGGASNWRQVLEALPDSADMVKARNRQAVDSQETRSLRAEELARNRRLDRDALVAAALQRLESSAIEVAGSGLNANVWIAFYTSFTGRTLKADDVAGLLAEIRAELSPLVSR